MLTAHKLKIIHDLIASSSKEDLIWLNGYLAGIIAHQENKDEDVAEKNSSSKITIAYGTETGNSKRLALDFAAKAKKNGINAKLVSLDQYRLNDLAKEEYFFTVISTQGEGEPPAAAKKFYDHIHQNGFKLNQLKYGVLALGDTAYPLFCKAGEDVDSQLQQLGGERIVSLQRCDVDYEDEASNWFMEVLQKINNKESKTEIVKSPPAKKATGKKIYTGTILSNINLNDRGSNKQTHHIEIAAADVDYQPGDSLGLVPENPLMIVEEIIKLTNIDHTKSLTHRNEEISIFNLLKKKLNIVYLPERVVKKYASIIKQEIPETKIGLHDLLKIYPVTDPEQFEEVINILELTAPRLYSISSSPEAHNGEIHLTVAKDFFTVNEEKKYGLCSNLLSEFKTDENFEFYIHKNTQFKLPAADKDIIMIGPGTGIAPFRSFLAERDATGATGKNWLFFGDQHFTSDFLYQTELQNWLQTNVLTKLSVAFSRDQKEKIYVQNKMKKHGAEFFEWLQSGAYIYVCGAKEPMAVDVEETLLSIIKEFGNKNINEAATYLDELKETGRYLKDVY
jgi:sulfite reductase (NADPH) flavoprotein alpha-component